MTAPGSDAVTGLLCVAIARHLTELLDTPLKLLAQAGACRTADWAVADRCCESQPDVPEASLLIAGWDQYVAAHGVSNGGNVHTACCIAQEATALDQLCQLINFEAFELIRQVLVLVWHIRPSRSALQIHRCRVTRLTSSHFLKYVDQAPGDST